MSFARSVSCGSEIVPFLAFKISCLVVSRTVFMSGIKREDQSAGKQLFSKCHPLIFRGVQLLNVSVAEDIECLPCVI